MNLQVVQLYMKWPKTSVPVPQIQLVGFERVPVRVNVEQTVHFSIQPHQLAVWWDDKTGWQTPSGREF